MIVGKTTTMVYYDTAFVRPVNIAFENKAEHTIKGYEEINEVKYLKVEIITVSTANIPEGDQMTVEGDIESYATYYYDFKNGIIIKYVLNFFFEATTSQSGGGVMSYVIENKIEYDLVK